jgi:hypothetical protein
VIASLIILSFLIFLFVAYTSIHLIYHMVVLKPPPKKRTARVSAAFRGSINSLFDAALVFGLSMLITTYIFLFKAADATIYEATFAATSSRLASLAVVSLWYFASEAAHITVHVAFFFVANCGLTIGLLRIGDALAFAPESAWETVCVYQGNPRGAMSETYTDVLIWVSIGGCVVVNRRIWDTFATKLLPERQRMLVRSVLRLIFMWPCLIGVFALLVQLLLQRTSMQIYSGSSYEEDTWGFGQYLAVATWIPTIMKLLHMFFGKPCYILSESGVKN